MGCPKGGERPAPTRAVCIGLTNVQALVTGSNTCVRACVFAHVCVCVCARARLRVCMLSKTTRQIARSTHESTCLCACSTCVCLAASVSVSIYLSLLFLFFLSAPRRSTAQHEFQSGRRQHRCGGLGPPPAPRPAPRSCQGNLSTAASVSHTHTRACARAHTHTRSCQRNKVSTATIPTTHERAFVWGVLVCVCVCVCARACVSVWRKCGVTGLGHYRHYSIQGFKV